MGFTIPADHQNLTILTNSICTNQKQSKKMKLITFSLSLRYKQIVQSIPENKILYSLTKKEFLIWRILPFQQIILWKGKKAKYKNTLVKDLQKFTPIVIVDPLVTIS